MYRSVKIFLLVTGAFVLLNAADRLLAAIPREKQGGIGSAVSLITDLHFWLVVFLIVLIVVLIMEEYFSGKYRNLYWEQLSDDEARFVRKFMDADPCLKKAVYRVLDADLSIEDEKFLRKFEHKGGLNE